MLTGIPITYNVIALSVECFNVKYSKHRVCDEATLRLRRIAHLSDPTQLRRRSWNSLGKPPKAITLKNVVYRIYRIEMMCLSICLTDTCHDIVTDTCHDQSQDLPGLLN